MIHNRDAIFSTEVDQNVRNLGLRVLKTPVRTPVANAMCERVIGTMRHECLDLVIPLNARHLCGMLKAWVEHYNSGGLARAYQGLFEVAETSKFIRVLPCTSRAVERYLDLRSWLPRLGKMDLSIAAIAFEYDGIVVTRKRRDFAQMPHLQVVDWSQPENAASR